MQTAALAYARFSAWHLQRRQESYVQHGQLSQLTIIHVFPSAGLGSLAPAVLRIVTNLVSLEIGNKFEIFWTETLGGV